MKGVSKLTEGSRSLFGNEARDYVLASNNVVVSLDLLETVFRNLASSLFGGVRISVFVDQAVVADVLISSVQVSSGTAVVVGDTIE